jgi:hypothetical protein
MANQQVSLVKHGYYDEYFFDCEQNKQDHLVHIFVPLRNC